MGKASDLAKKDTFGGLRASGRTASKPYRFRFVDPAEVDPALESEVDPISAADSFAEFREEIAQNDRTPTRRHDDADDHIVSPIDHVDMRALPKSPRREIEQNETRRHRNRYDIGSHVATASASLVPTSRGRLVQFVVLSGVVICGAGLGGIAYYYAEDIGRGLTAAKSAIVRPTRPAETAANELGQDAKSVPQMPIAQSQPAQSQPAQSQPAQSQPAQSQPVKSSVEETQPAASGPVLAPSNSTSPLAKSLFDLGALSCISRANQISKFLSDGREAIVLQKPIGNADRTLLMATLLPTTSDRKQDFSIVTLSPNQASGCDGNYQSIRVIEKPCPNAVSEIYGANRAKQIGNAGIAMVAINQTTRVFAIPATNICVMVKQELVQ